MSVRLSRAQRRAVELVKAGRVEWGAEDQAMARRGHCWVPVWLIDGYSAYGSEHRTYQALETRGVIRVRHDLVPCHRVPEQVKTYRSLLGPEQRRTIPAHDEPVDSGWRARVEIAIDLDEDEDDER